MDANKRELGSPKSDATDDEEEQGWDTQYCQRLQDELLSSSLRNSQTASTHENDGKDQSSDDDNTTVDDGNDAADDGMIVCFQVEGLDVGASEAQSPTHQQSPPAGDDSTIPVSIEDNNEPNLIIDTETSKLGNKHHNNTKPGAVDTNGNSALPVQLDAAPAKMDGLTQLSSLSPTQENPASVYAQYAFQTSADVGASASTDAVGKEVSEHTQADVAGHQPVQMKHHSTVTDSTIHTYGENDTGHVNFDGFAIGENHQDDNSSEREESLSQDASFAPRAENPPRQHAYEPQTPAPPVNPFSQKGTVMRSHEMFKATQPSSIGRHMLSATSSRPSPDVYNDFTSPAKWMPPSSPLVRRFEPIDSSPLQSSVRSLLGSEPIGSLHHAASLPVTGAKLLGEGPGSPPRSSIRQPLQYVSMKESQERRQKETSSSSADSDTESDSDLDDISTKRQRERKRREEEIQKQLSTIELHKNISVSSRPVSPSPGEVEVPSTSKGRRRSQQEEYTAQCEGFDARDTQQDDIVADSQSVLDNPMGSGQERVPASSKPTIIRQGGSSDACEPDKRRSSSMPAHPCNKVSGSVPDRDQASSDPMVNTLNDPSSPPEQPSLPLKEVSTNCSDVRTPSINKPHVFSDLADMTVPETSPLEDRIRPIGEIASISFGENNADGLQGLPGFTQGTEFEKTIMPQTSPDPTPRQVKNRRAVSQPAFAPSVADTETLVVTTASANAPSKQDSQPTSIASQHEPTTSDHRSTNPLEQTTSSKVPSRGKKRVSATKKRDSLVKQSEAQRLQGHSIPEHSPIPSKREGLRSRDDLKGPSRSLRRSGADTPGPALVTPKHPSPSVKLTPTTKTNSTRSSRGIIASSPPSSTHSAVSTPRSIITRSLTQRGREETPLASLGKGSKDKPSNISILPTPQLERPLKRKSGTTDATEFLQRDSKRRSVIEARDSSLDPLSLPCPPPAGSIQRQKGTRLFANMAFAVSYVNQQDEKEAVNSAISENGGWVLDEGFDVLFDLRLPSKPRSRSGVLEGLTITPAAHSTGFVALIADEHSRRVKYMQALALGLPCISGKWILECISKDEIVDWSVYLLCAGLSSFLGNAMRSRTLQPYLATEAAFSENFAVRKQFLEGKSILAVMSKGSIAERRQHYIFLMRVLGPSRLEQVADLKQARKALLENKQSWDLVYVGDNEKHAADALFGQAPTSSANSKKRKKGPTPSAAEPAPEKVRIISDEVVIQSLILGQLL